MKKTFFLILAFSLLSFSLFAQWTQAMSGTYDRLWVVDFADETNAVIGSSDNNGTFLISDDEGFTWDNTNTGTEYRFYDIDMLNSNQGFGCGFAVFMTTNDGGENWVFSEIAGTTFIQNLDFINQDTGWIVGFQGMIKRTNDGGENWETQTTGVPHDIWEIQAINNDVIFAAGRNVVTEKGMFFKTTDGGLNWETEEIPNMLMSVACIDDQKWFAGGERGRLYQTVDGGENWDYITIKSQTDIMEIKFLDENYGFLMCYDDDDPYSPNSYIYQTTNGGTTWELSHQTSSKKLYSIAFSSKNHGIACGSDGFILVYDVDTNVEIDENMEMNIFPNPNNGIFTIKNISNFSNVSSLIITNISGQIVKQNQIFPSQYSGGYDVDLQSLPKGIYFVNLQSENRIYSQKIVVQ